jgi:Xaa-Pro aminopeptidase
VRLPTCSPARAPATSSRRSAASLDYHCRRRGAARLSFPPVVAGGRNALTIHYITNDALLRDGDVVLLDGGCEFGGYVSDISRAFPVAPKFSDGSATSTSACSTSIAAALHSATLSASAATPPLTIESLQTTASRWLTEHLLDMGILKGTLADNVARRAFQRFYPHNIGHWLGMDTHDTPQVPTTTPLQPSMCITIEPGLYIGADRRRARQVPQHRHSRRGRHRAAPQWRAAHSADERNCQRRRRTSKR